MSILRVGIVGGGPAGLATALAIRARFGVRANVQVFERASTHSPTAGAGFGLCINGAAVLAAMGLKNAIVPLGAPVERAILANGFGERLGSTRMRPRDEAAYPPGMPLIQGVLRGEFMQALVAALPPGSVRFGSTPVSVDEDRGRLTFDDGKTEEFDVIVGADGLRSFVRASVFGPDEPTYSGYGIFYGVSIAPGPHPLLERNAMTQAYGTGLGVIAVPTEPAAASTVDGGPYTAAERSRWAEAAGGPSQPRNRIYYYGVTFKQPDRRLAGTREGRAAVCLAQNVRRASCASPRSPRALGPARFEGGPGEPHG